MSDDVMSNRVPGEDRARTSPVSVSGLDYLSLATELLHRVRLADPTAGLWEAADVQWWWRKPRISDSLGQAFWVDSEGPVGAVLLTEWDGKWQCDLIVVPEHVSTLITELWSHALRTMKPMGLNHIEVLVRDDDELMLKLLADAGFMPEGSPDETGGVTWMPATARPMIPALPKGYRLVDRNTSPERRHWLESRNGPEIEDRLLQSSLYDPSLDLAVESTDGEIAAYGLFWHDPVTSVGLVEPMRTEDAHQRIGIARAVLANGLDRLARCGAHRLKVGYATAAARDLYTGSGFRVEATDRAFVAHG
jgi:ribosomal protein S18 acetylase RimI-like enzyme